MSHIHPHRSSAIVLAGLLLAAGPAGATLLYDAISAATLPPTFGFQEGISGQEITLDGPASVDLFEFVLELAGGTTGNATVSFHLPDGPADEPGTLLWTSTSVPFSRGGALPGYTILGVAAPDVVVPETFVWVVDVEVTSASGSAGVSFVEAPTVGTAGILWSYSSPSGWLDSISSASAGARVSGGAVPEPSTGLLLAAGLFGLAAGRRRS